MILKIMFLGILSGCSVGDPLRDATDVPDFVATVKSNFIKLS